MSDLFNNATPQTATDLGIFAFQNTYKDAPSSSRFFKFESVGTTETGDAIDYYSFYAYNLDTIKFEFDASTLGDYANHVIILPVEGIKGVNGEISASWTGGEHTSTDSVFGGLVAKTAETLAQAATLSLTGTVDTSGTTSSSSQSAATGEWKVDNTQDGGLVKIVFSVQGFEYEGSQNQILGNNALPGEVDYRITITPKVGLNTPPAGTGNEFTNTSASEHFSGGSTGVDVVSYSLGRDSYMISTEGSTTFKITNADGIEVDTATGIERIKFSDGTLALDVNGTAGQAYRIYKAAFARAPDNDGVKHWIGTMDGGKELLDVARDFVFSAEFKSIYGTAPTSLEIVQKLYQNVLGRDGETGGVNFWTGEINAGHKSIEQVLSDFSESPENIAGVAPDINNGIFFV